MDLALRRWAIAGSAVVLALVIGWNVGNESLGLAVLVGAASVLLALNMWLGVAPDALVGGLAVVGYLVGNRGFAQLNASHVPLLPGEATLAIGLACCAWRSARTKRLPILRDWVNGMLLVFILIGTIRVPFDMRTYGVMGLRDFAMVYYAAFFFLAQDWVQDPACRRWIVACFTVGFAFVLPAFAAFQLWPDFLIEHLTLNGIPLIYIKVDIASGFLVAAVFWFLHAYVSKGGWPNLVIAAANLAGVLMSNSRAAVTALAVDVALLAVVWAAFRSGRMLRWFAIFGAVGAFALVADALVPREPGNVSHLYRLYERARTMVDLSGTYVPQTADLIDKPDNNLFRLVWWKEVISETTEANPWLGLGFGHDLAERFAKVYYPEETEEFSVRSPHSIIVSVYARMGLLGLALGLGLVVAAAAQTWRDISLRADHQPHPAWLGTWAILILACFGVVLEGPMGAVVFWILFGLANAETHSLLTAPASGPQPGSPAETPVAKAVALDTESAIR
jgi:O-antigen ligase